MKIIQFPKDRKSSTKTPSKNKDVESNYDGEVIDFGLFNNDFETEFLDSPSEIEISIMDGDGNSFFDKVMKAAKDVSADEGDMAAAICTMVDELTKKTEPLREKYFLPTKSFYKMLGNVRFEAKFNEILRRFPSMSEYHDLTLSQVAIMLDKKWPFKKPERAVLDFALHLVGALKHIDLLRLKAYLSSKEWQIAMSAAGDLDI